MVKTVALIPLRGGSKSIPLKNIKSMAGKPLAHWTIKAALDCELIDKVVVSTDSEQIIQALSYLKSDKIEFFKSSAETATDTASTESAMLDYFEKFPSEYGVLIQATSPMLEATHLKEAIAKFHLKKFDSLLSLVRSKRFYWNELDSCGLVSPINYVPNARPRRQDFKGTMVENGAFYIFSISGFLKEKVRLFGTIGGYEMPENTFIEIDEVEDWCQVEKELLAREQKKLAPIKIKLFATDVDGVLTDAGMYYSENGDEQKKFNTRDGKGFEFLRNIDITTAIITAENTKIVERRGKKLKIDIIRQGAHDKLSILKEMCRDLNITLQEVAYIGDDVNDLEVMKAVGLSFCPQDAVTTIQNSAKVICQAKGGGGCVREAIEYVIALNK